MKVLPQVLAGKVKGSGRFWWRIKAGLETQNSRVSSWLGGGRTCGILDHTHFVGTLYWYVDKWWIVHSLEGSMTPCTIIFVNYFGGTLEGLERWRGWGNESDSIQQVYTISGQDYWTGLYCLSTWSLIACAVHLSVSVDALCVRSGDCRLEQCITTVCS